MSFVHRLFTVVSTDLRLEWRAANAFVSALFLGFSVFVLAAASYQNDNIQPHLLASGSFWLSLFVGGHFLIPRLWHRERDGGALDALLLAGADAQLVLAAKVTLTWLLLLCLAVLYLPITVLVFGLPMWSVARLDFAGLVLATTLALSVTGTLFGAMLIRTRTRDAAVSIVLLPLTLPALLTAAGATRALWDVHAAASLWPWLRMVLAYDLIVATLAFLLFPSLVDVD